MGNATSAPTTAVTTIAAIITPALFILASASLIASVLVRMARVVDRARVFAEIAYEGAWEKLGVTPDVLSAWLARHAARALCREVNHAPLRSSGRLHRDHLVDRTRPRNRRGTRVVTRLAHDRWHAPLARRRYVDGRRVAPFRQSNPGRDLPRTHTIGGENSMTYAPLDPNDAVILFADLQTGIIELSMTNDLAHLRRAVSALAKLARLFDIPAIVTTAPAEGGAHVTPEIAASLGNLPAHTRTTTDVFTHAPTRDAITKTGRKTLLIAGVATEIIVQHSALSSAAQGFHVQVVVDACGGLSPRTEDAALRRLTQAGVVTTSIASLAGQLAGDFTQPQGANALGILYELASS